MCNKSNRGSDREKRALKSSLEHHNFSTKIIPDPMDQVAKDEVDDCFVLLHTWPWIRILPLLPPSPPQGFHICQTFFKASLKCRALETESGGQEPD